MIEELIEKIWALSTGLDITYKFDNGFSECKRQVLKILEPYKVYDELIEKVSAWWDEFYSEGLLVSRSDMGDKETMLRITEIRELLDRIKVLSEKR